MLQITVMPPEAFDEAKNEFVYFKPRVLQLEHSLVSLAKWESKWCKPFLSKEKKTYEEMIDYIRCMTLTQNVDPTTYDYLTRANIEEIQAYINQPMTASTVPSKGGQRNKEQVTAELIYYWMISQNIPFECQKWHLNRLVSLIKVCSFKNAPAKKMSRREIMKRNTALNNARRSKLGSKG